jgi:hypothetical protein
MQTITNLVTEEISEDLKTNGEMQNGFIYLSTGISGELSLTH